MNVNDGRDATEVVMATRGALAEPLPGPAILDAEFSEATPRHLRDYLRVLYKYRWLAAACFGVTFGLVAVMTLLTPRLYSAATRLQVSRESPIHLRLDDNVLNVAESERTVNGTSSFLATQVAALKSRDLAERVIRSHHLADQDAFVHPGPQRGGLVAVGGRLLSMLRPRGWQATSGGSASADHAAGEVDPVLLDRYINYLEVGDVRGTDLIEVRFTTPNPTLSALLAAAHTQAYLEANEEARLATDVTAKEFLGQQIAEARAQVDRAETTLRAFATVHPNVAVNEEQKLVGQRITDLTSLISKAEGSRVTMETRYEFLTKRTSDPLAYFLDRPGIQKLHLGLLDVRAQRAAFDGRLGPNHPQMQELARTEHEIAQQLAAEVDHEVAAVRARYDAALLRERGLRLKLGHLEKGAIDLRDLGAQYARLKDDVESASGLHQSLLKQRMETAVNAALAASNVRVIERAEVPRRAAKPNVPMNLVLGLLAGGMCALGATFFCEYFDSSVKSSEEVEGLLQLPTLATVPNFALARRSRAARPLAPPSDVTTPAVPSAFDAIARELVMLHEPWSPIAEAFRGLRTAVLFSVPAAPPKVIQMTSAGAGEGKTVSSLNLAAALAETGSRVLLIDVDLRRPACHRALGVDKARGLSSYLAGQLELDDAIQKLEAPRISFIPAGPTPPNPAELIGSQRMRDTLELLRERYDFIILDSPPVLPVTDAVLLSREADGVVIVVKGHDTPRELLRRARDQLAQANARLLGAVVNNVDLGWGDLFFYNRYYGYYAAPAVEART